MDDTHTDSTRICIKCGVEKSLTEFGLLKSSKSGRNSVCRVCRSECGKKYYKEHAEKVKTLHKKQRKEQPELVRTYKRKWYREHTASVKISIKRWRKKHPELIKLYGRRWRTNHLEYCRLRHSRRQKEHSEVLKIYHKKWRKENPEKILSYKHKRRTSKSLAGGSFTGAEWLDLIKFYDHTCLRCEKKEPEIKLTADHVIPVVKGGTSFISNIQPLCGPCNSTKNDKDTDYRLTFVQENIAA